MPIFNSQPLCCLILLIPYPHNSKSFSPPQTNAIALHHPTNTHHTLPIYYTAPSHKPCIFNISNTMLLLILVKIAYILQAQIPHTQHIAFERKSQITHTMWYLQPRVCDGFPGCRKCWCRRRNSLHAIQKHIQHQNSTPSCQS